MRVGLAGIVAAAHLAGTALALGAPVPAVDPAAACVRAATAAERRWGLPAHLLEAIGMVESGRRDPDSGQPLPWPWSVNVAGAGYVFGAATAAGTAVGLFQAHGVTSIDIGCFQVNLHYHPRAFASVAEGFDPAANGDYTAASCARCFNAAAAGRRRSAITIPPTLGWAARIARGCCGRGGGSMPGWCYRGRATRTSSSRRHPRRRFPSTRR